MLGLVAFLYLAGCVLGGWLGSKLMLAGLRLPAPGLAPAYVCHHGRPAFGAWVRLGAGTAARDLWRAAQVGVGMVLVTSPWHLVYVISVVCG